MYLEHRQFLPREHTLHRDRCGFPHSEDYPPPPKMKTMKYIDKANGRYAAAETANKRKEVAQETGCKGSYALRQLPGHDRVANTPMHLLKNIAEHLINLSGVEDSEKVRCEEQSRGRFGSAWHSDTTSAEVELPPAKVKLPPATFVLTKSSRKLQIRE